MHFLADLHLHSHFSRATSKNLDLENLYIAAQLKGISVVATGDIVHPGWLAEVKEKLVEAEPGLYRLKDELAVLCDQQVALSCRAPVRFILSAEISNIYKKNGQTRKNHNIVYFKSIEEANKFGGKLDQIGNIRSDGRPILGLDARDLLEILIENSEHSFLIPAHIWTPWFSLLGSKSGFESLEECFEDLSGYIFAVETGLSSDPPMNWRVKGLDGLTLVSNSDAHSPRKLGREANIFNCRLSYDDIRMALKNGDKEHFQGTIEFYPEEGKYHLDGHRKCGLRLTPEDTKRFGSKCPVCDGLLTEGVLNRVQHLAQRAQGEKPEKWNFFYHLIPLDEILGQILNVGPSSKKVKRHYAKALSILGSELKILHKLDYETIRSANIPLLDEAIRRMRGGNIEVKGGYDGEFGKIRIFKKGEMEHLIAQRPLFFMPYADEISAEEKIKEQYVNKCLTSESLIKKSHTDSISDTRDADVICVKSVDGDGSILAGLNPRQKRVVLYPSGPILVAAGPGTGKTRTLTHRIAYLIKAKKVDPDKMLALTFTNQAAQEMEKRLKKILPEKSNIPQCTTFHALCLQLIMAQSGFRDFQIIDDSVRRLLIKDIKADLKPAGDAKIPSVRELIKRIAQLKQHVLAYDDDFGSIVCKEQVEIIRKTYKQYQTLLRRQKLMDFDDLLFNVVIYFEQDNSYASMMHKKYQYLFIDEYQDLNQAQYRIVRSLAPGSANICVIGDPNQAIYGFRGSDVRYFTSFVEDYPTAEVTLLDRNYRSTETILKASCQVLDNLNKEVKGCSIYSGIHGKPTIDILQFPSDRSEANGVGKRILQMVGGRGFHDIDMDRSIDANIAGDMSFADFGVLARTNEQLKILVAVFIKMGIPFHIASREATVDIKEIAALLSFLRIIEGCGHYFDFERLSAFAKWGIGSKTLKIFKHWGLKKELLFKDALYHIQRIPLAAITTANQKKLDKISRRINALRKSLQSVSVEQKLVTLVKEMQLNSCIEENQKLKQAFDLIIEISKAFKSDAQAFLTSVALKHDADLYQHKAQRVSFLSMHASKGLEFRVVFILGCEDDIVPLYRPQKSEINTEEERRLFYVAMTRAMQKLYLCWAEKRLFHGKLKPKTLSPFVQDIDNKLKRHQSLTKEIKRPEIIHRQLKLF